jgi:hypothetical protein
VPVAGRKPKPDGQAVTRHKPTHDWTEVVNEPYAGARPELPATRTVMTQFGPQDVALREMTTMWWDSASTMPHCILWAASDWSFALTTAMVADAAFSGGVGAATELRNREKVLGTTVDYRRDLRIRYVEPTPEHETPADVVTLDDYRDL